MARSRPPPRRSTPASRRARSRRSTTTAPPRSASAPARSPGSSRSSRSSTATASSAFGWGLAAERRGRRSASRSSRSLRRGRSGGPDGARSAAAARARRGRRAAVRAPGALPDRATASRAGSAPGKPTTFSYAYLIASLLVAVTATSIALVSSVPLARGELTPERAARHVVAASWVSLALVAAAAGVFALAGARGRAASCSARATAAAPAPSSAGSSPTSRPWMVASVALSVAFPLLFVRGRARVAAAARGRGAAACRCSSSGRARRCVRPRGDRGGDGGDDRRRPGRAARRARRAARDGCAGSLVGGGHLRRCRRSCCFGRRGSSSGALPAAASGSCSTPARSPLWRPPGLVAAWGYLRHLDDVTAVCPSAVGSPCVVLSLERPRGHARLPALARARSRRRRCSRSSSTTPRRDGTAEAVARRVPAGRADRNDANLGFAGRQQRRASARALELGAAHVLVLNNDVEVDPGFAAALARGGRAPRPTPARSCPQDPLRRARRTLIWFAGASYDPRAGYNGRQRGYGERDDGRFDEVVDDRPRLRRGDARPAGRARAGRSLRRASSSSTARTPTGRCAPARPGSGTTSSRRAGCGTRSRVALGRRELADDALLRHPQLARGRRAARAARPARHLAPAARAARRASRPGAPLGAPPRGPRGGARRAGATRAPAAWARDRPN